MSEAYEAKSLSGQDQILMQIDFLHVINLYSLDTGNLINHIF